MTAVRPTALLAAALLLTACGDAPASSDTSASAASTEGRLVIVGGALDGANADVYNAVLAGREGDGPFCVMPTASGVPETSMASSIERFREYGADSVIGIWVTEENLEAASDPEIVAQIESCSGYWFVGGQQKRIIQAFRPTSGDTPGYTALMQRWRDGAVVAGSSAGAAMMSSRSIGGGGSDEAVEFGVVRDADGDFVADGDGLWILPGMDYVTWGIVDQHHLARGRWGRLVSGVLDEVDSFGLGIDENTAILYENGVAEVIGHSSVLMVDVSQASMGDDPRTATGIRLFLLGTGDQVDVQTMAVTRASAGKSAPAAPMPTPEGQEPGADDEFVEVPTLDEIAAAPFESWAFLHLMNYFAAGELEQIVVDGGARLMTIRTGDGFRGEAFPSEERVEEAGTPMGLSVGPLLLDVTMPGG